MDDFFNLVGTPYVFTANKAKKGAPSLAFGEGAPFWRPPAGPGTLFEGSGAGLFFFEKATQAAKPPLGALAGFRLFCFGLFMLLSLLLLLLLLRGGREKCYIV